MDNDSQPLISPGCQETTFQKSLLVPPTGIEPISAEPESAILSIELRRQGNSGAKVQLFCR